MALDTSFNTAITQEIGSLVKTEKLQIADAIFSSASKIGDFAPKHNIVTDVRNGSYVPIITEGNNYNSLSASKEGCEMNECEFDDVYSSKKWVIGEYDCRFAICLRTYTDDFLRFWNMWNQKLDNPLDDPDKDAFFAYLINKGRQRIQGALWRTGYWGDTTATANALISKNNGLFTNADAGDGLKQTLTLVDGDITGESLYKQLSEAYIKVADEDWFEAGETQIVMTKKMATKLVTWLNSLSDLSPYNCNCIDPTKVVASRVFAIDNLSLFGLPVVANKEVDKARKKGLGVEAGYQALFINKSNMVVGVNTTEHLEQFDVIYDPIKKNVLVDVKIQIGASIPLDEYLYLTESTAG